MFQFQLMILGVAVWSNAQPENIQRQHVHGALEKIVPAFDVKHFRDHKDIHYVCDASRQGYCFIEKHGIVFRPCELKTDEYYLTTLQCLSEESRDAWRSMETDDTCEWIPADDSAKVLIEQSPFHSHFWAVEGSRDEGYTFSRRAPRLTTSLEFVTFVGTVQERSCTSLTSSGQCICPRSTWRFFPSIMRDADSAQRITVWCSVHPRFKDRVLLQVRHTNLWLSIDPATSELVYTSVPETAHELVPRNEWSKTTHLQTRVDI